MASFSITALRTKTLLRSTLGREWPAFRAVAVAIVPEAARLDREGWRQLEAIVEVALGERPASMARRLRLLLRFLDALAMLRYRRRLPALDPLLRARLLATVQDSRLVLLRRGFWGLKTLVLLGYYGRADASSEIGYRADLRGWPSRRLNPERRHE